MSLMDHFNNQANAETPPSPYSLGLELLELVQRKKDGASANRNINEDAIDLIERGAALGVKDLQHGRDVLMWASINFRQKILHAILDRNPDILAQDNDGKTALDLARQFKQKPAIELLEGAEIQRRIQVMREAKDVTTKRETKVFKPLHLKKRSGQGQGQNGQS